MNDRHCLTRRDHCQTKHGLRSGSLTTLAFHIDRCFFFFSSRRRHTRWTGDWSSDVCSSDLARLKAAPAQLISFRQLIRELEIDSDQRHEIRHLLHEMVKEGTLIKLKGNRYTLPDRKSVV